MKSVAAIGIGHGVDAQETAMQAAQHALDVLGAQRPVFAIIFIDQEFNPKEALSGLLALIGDTPVWGFGADRLISAAADEQRAVIVILAAGSDLKAQAHWWPTFSHDAAQAARLSAQLLRQETLSYHEALVVMDGVNGSPEQFFAALQDPRINLSGALSAGEPGSNHNVQIGKNQAGAGALSMLLLGGDLRIGVGLAHGWQRIGVYFQVTRARDVWLQDLDQAPAAEAYARYMGGAARDWALPPLNRLVRLYPLGLEGADGALSLRSPLRAEADGSLRMTAPVPAGSTVHLMVGDPQACLDAVRKAAADAQLALGNARALFALVLVDTAYEMILATRPGALVDTLRAALGDIPFAGAYTLGQIARPANAPAPVAHNQHVEIILIGEAVG